MSFIVGNILQIAISMLLVLSGFIHVLVRVLNFRCDPNTFWGLLFAAVLAIPAFFLQGAAEALIYLAKLVSLVFVFHVALLRSRAVLIFLAVSSLSFFLIEMNGAGYSKLNTIPFEALALFLLVWSAHKRVSRRLAVLSVVVILALASLQSVLLASRGGMVFVLLAAILLLAGRYRKHLILLMFALPIFYIAVMALVGHFFVSGTPIVPLSKSNLERSIMLYHLVESFPLSPFGVNQREYSITVNESLSAYQVKGFSEYKMDPHSFLGHIFMYSGWIGFLVFVVLLFRFFMRIKSAESSFLIFLIVPVSYYMVLITVSPPSTFSRVSFVAFCGCVLGLLQQRIHKDMIRSNFKQV